MKIRVPRIIAGVCIGIVALPVLAIGIFVFVWVFLGSNNARDNASSRKRAEMAEISLQWGRLAPFPKTARNFTIRTEGSAFTRTFIGSFTDSPEAISKWLRDSRGVSEGKLEMQDDHSAKYILKMGGGASYGEVTVSADGSSVSFKIEWS